jgi:hypothetical protein
VKALERAGAEPSRLIPSPVVGKLVHPHQQAWRAFGAIAEHSPTRREQRRRYLPLISEPTKPVEDLLPDAGSSRRYASDTSRPANLARIELRSAGGPVHAVHELRGEQETRGARLVACANI